MAGQTETVLEEAETNKYVLRRMVNFDFFVEEQALLKTSHVPFRVRRQKNDLYRRRSTIYPYTSSPLYLGGPGPAIHTPRAPAYILVYVLLIF